jgi:ORF6N domain
MVRTASNPATVQRIEEMIFLIRGQRVMLDSDLAKIYGVTTAALNQALKRNADRFPVDFAFQVVRQEFTALISQSVISKKSRGGRTKLPWVFTEHGALMLGNVLNSNTATQASVRVVRAFVLMREQLAAHKELGKKLSELENRVSGHDEAIQNLFEAIRQLIEPPLPENRKQIGFMRETAPLYRLKTSKRF